VGVYFSLFLISQKNNSHTTFMSNTFIYVRAPFVRGNNEKDGKCFKVVQKRMNRKEEEIGER